MSKFQVGDKVRVVYINSQDFGRIDEVVEIDHDIIVCRHSGRWGCESSLELVDRKTPFYAPDFCLDPGIIAPDYYRGVDFGRTDAAVSGVSHTGEPIKKNNLITKTMNFIKQSLLSAEDKKLIKAGFLTENLELTSEGAKALQYINFKANKAELVTMADAEIAEQEAAK